MVDMPRKAPIDAPGALHHIVVRGIDRRKIFFDDSDLDGLFCVGDYDQSPSLIFEDKNVGSHLNY
jgi:hypothetical protein